MNKLSVYVHVPFCRRKCRYCDFVSLDDSYHLAEDYFEILKKEIDIRKDEIGSREISTVYFGGGTPSSVDEIYITGILEHIRNSFRLRDDAEITVEANPESASFEKLACYRKAGFNRISMGLQSANDETLERIGRIHDFRTFEKAFDNARNAGFDNINVDLMLSLPKESIENFSHSLEEVLRLDPEHVSVYSLILEEGTPLFRDYEKGLYEEDDGLDRQMYHLAKDRLEEAGYIQYEISNFARKGYHSRHNMYCWDYEEYAGFGLNASSFVNGIRKKNSSLINEYLKGIRNSSPNYDEYEILSAEEKKKEYIMLALRKTSGIDMNDYLLRFSERFQDEYETQIKKLTDEGLCEMTASHFSLTEKGLDFANTVMIMFI